MAPRMELIHLHICPTKEDKKWTRRNSDPFRLCFKACLSLKLGQTSVSLSAQSMSSWGSNYDPSPRSKAIPASRFSSCSQIVRSIPPIPTHPPECRRRSLSLLPIVHCRVVCTRLFYPKIRMEVGSCIFTKYKCLMQDLNKCHPDNNTTGSSRTIRTFWGSRLQIPLYFAYFII